MHNKKTYESLEMKILCFEDADVDIITTSGGGDEDPFMDDIYGGEFSA